MKHQSAQDELNPLGAQIISDFDKWCALQHYANFEGPVHALGLHRDPSRGRTHVLFREIEYVESAQQDLSNLNSKVRDRWRVARCGVFKVDNVRKDIASIVGHGLGEQCDALLERLRDTSNGMMSAIMLTWAPKIKSSFKTGAFGSSPFPFSSR